MLLNATNQKNVYYCINSIGTLTPPRASAWRFFWFDASRLQRDLLTILSDFIAVWTLSRPAAFCFSQYRNAALGKTYTPEATNSRALGYKARVGSPRFATAKRARLSSRTQVGSGNGA